MNQAPTWACCLSWGFLVERVTGIEPALSAWEADVLPLNYTRRVAPPYLMRHGHALTTPAGSTGVPRPATPVPIIADRPLRPVGAPGGHCSPSDGTANPTGGHRFHFGDRRVFSNNSFRCNVSHTFVGPGATHPRGAPYSGRGSPWGCVHPLDLASSRRRIHISSFSCWAPPPLAWRPPSPWPVARSSPALRRPALTRTPRPVRAEAPSRIRTSYRQPGPSARGRPRRGTQRASQKGKPGGGSTNATVTIPVVVHVSPGTPPGLVAPSRTR